MHADTRSARIITVSLAAIVASVGVSASAQAAKNRPDLVEATYFGGKQDDVHAHVARARNGGAFLAGTTDSSGLATINKQQCKGDDSNGLIVRFDSDGDRKWARCIGGDRDEEVRDLEVNEHNSTFIVGSTLSDHGIATDGVEQEHREGQRDGFLIKLDDDGDRLWGTYLGGNDEDVINAVIVAGNGDIYVCGSTTSKNKIATDDTEQHEYRGDGDGFVAKYDDEGDRKWSRYIGGHGKDSCEALAVDGKRVYIAGTTKSKEKIFKDGAEDDHCDGDEDAFVARLDDHDGDVVWGRRFRGERDDRGEAIAVDKSGDVYVAGSTNSKHGIASKEHAHQDDLEGERDLFLAKFSESGKGKRVWSTYYGGDGREGQADLATRGNDEVYLAGQTESKNHIATEHAVFDDRGGDEDVFVVKFDGHGDRKWGTYFGGGEDDVEPSIDTYGGDRILLAGATKSDKRIAAHDPFQDDRKGGWDLFLAVLDDDGESDDDHWLVDENAQGCGPDGVGDPSLGLFLAFIPLALRPRRTRRTPDVAV